MRELNVRKLYSLETKDIGSRIDYSVNVGINDTMMQEVRTVTANLSDEVFERCEEWQKK